MKRGWIIFSIIFLLVLSVVSAGNFFEGGAWDAFLQGNVVREESNVGTFFEGMTGWFFNIFAIRKVAVCPEHTVVLKFGRSTFDRPCGITLSLTSVEKDTATVNVVGVRDPLTLKMNEPVKIKDVYVMLFKLNAKTKQASLKVSKNPIKAPSSITSTQSAAKTCTTTAGYRCKDAFTQGYQKTDCSWNEQFTASCKPNGCTDGQCNPTKECRLEWRCMNASTLGFLRTDCLWDESQGTLACPNGCTDNKCNRAPSTTAGWKCKDAWTRGYQNDQGVWTTTTPCENGCNAVTANCKSPPGTCTAGWACKTTNSFAWKNAGCSLGTATYSCGWSSCSLTDSMGSCNRYRFPPCAENALKCFNSTSRACQNADSSWNKAFSLNDAISCAGTPTTPTPAPTSTTTTTTTSAPVTQEVLVEGTDLVITKVLMNPQNPVVNNLIDFTVYYKNRGTASALPYFSIISSNGPPLNTCSLGGGGTGLYGERGFGLASGAEDVVKLGNYKCNAVYNGQLSFIIDPSNRVKESNEANNVYWVPLNVAQQTSTTP